VEPAGHRHPAAQRKSTQPPLLICSPSVYPPPPRSLVVKLSTCAMTAEHRRSLSVCGEVSRDATDVASGSSTRRTSSATSRRRSFSVAGLRARSSSHTPTPHAAAAFASSVGTMSGTRDGHSSSCVSELWMRRAVSPPFWVTRPFHSRSNQPHAMRGSHSFKITTSKENLLAISNLHVRIEEKIAHSTIFFVLHLHKQLLPLIHINCN
jgi:hypothetical protein